MQCDTLIVSDVHLGSPLSMARELYHLLNTSTFKRLILLGDIFSDLNFGRLTKDHWKLISLIRKMSNPKRNIEVVWVEGNHDLGITMVMEHLLGVKVFYQYEWEWNGKKCIAMHGHQFDGLFSDGNPWFSSIITNVHLWLQKVGLLKRWLPTILDKIHTHYQRLTKKVAEGAIDAAKQERADYIFCGHTHEPYHQISGYVEYWNTGCWVGGMATFITLDEVDVALRDFSSTE